MMTLQTTWRNRTACAASLLCFLGLSTLANSGRAQEPTGQDEAAVSPSETISATTGSDSSGGSSGGGSSSSSEAEHARILKDFKTVDGLIPQHHKGARLFYELSSKHYNGEYIVLISISRGVGKYPLYGGFSWGFGDDWVWKFRKVDDRVHVIRSNVRFKADSGKPESRAVKHAYNDSVLFSLPIASKGPNGGDLIEMTPVFMSDLPMFSQVLPGFSFSPPKSVFSEVKGFDKNIELDVAATYASSGQSEIDSVPDSRGLSVNIHYSISQIPTTGYTPRLADDRVGYFLTAVKDFSQPKDNQFVRYVNRWNLQKAEPSEKMSEPKEPIIFYMENTIPYKYRKPIRDGILEWNKAFEKAGFINAIQVRQQEDDAEWDPEDVRYNTFRWITSDAGFAMGPSRVNPYTGQILDADIIFDADFVNYWKKSFENFNPEAMEAVIGGPLDAEQAYEMYQEGRFQSMIGKNCQLSGGMSQQMAFGAAAVLAASDKKDKEDKKKGKKKKDKEESDEEKVKTDKDDSDEEKKSDKEEKDSEDKDSEDKDSDEKDSKDKDEDKEESEKDSDPSKEEREALLEKLIMQGLKEVAMHEVGHTLGLRHNFKASKIKSLGEIHDSEDRSIPVGSVMDYIPVTLWPEGKPQGDFFPQTLGPYDIWAIEYGYTPYSGGTEGEKKELEKIAARSNEPELQYATDEDTTSVSPDPDSNRYDFGSDAFEFAEHQAEIVRKAMDGLTERLIEPGEDYSKTRIAFNVLLSTHGQSMYFVSRYIGGIHVSRSHKSEDGENPQPFEVVDVEKQRKAIKLLEEEIFSDKAYQFDPSLLNDLAPSYWNHWGSSSDMRGDLPVHNAVSRWQETILSRLLGSLNLERMHDAELRVPADEDALTTAELIERLTDAIFSEVESVEEGEFTNRQPAISSFRRNLQRSYVKRLSSLALGNLSAPEDCQTIAAAELAQLQSQIDDLLDKKVKLDSYSRAHLSETSRRIEKVLDADIILSRP